MSARPPRMQGPGIDRLLALAARGHRLCPAEVAGQPAGLLTDGRGLTAVLELDRSTDQLPVSGGTAQLPADAGLTVQPLLTVVPGATVAAPLAVQSLLALRVDSEDDPDPESCRQRLASALTWLQRQLRPARSSLLDSPTLATVLAELAHYHPHRTVRIGWSTVRIGGYRQACYRLPAGAAPATLLTGLPVLATAAGTEAGTVVRLASRTPAELARAETYLSGIAGDAGPIRRLRGRQRAGLAATLPLGRTLAPEPPPAVRSWGLPLGTDRAGNPRLHPLFGPRATRVLLIAERAVADRVGTAAAATGVGTDDDPAAAGSPTMPRLRRRDTFTPDIGRWCTELVRWPPDRPIPVDLLTQADVVLTRPLPEPQAAVVSAVLGLGRAGAWLRAGDPDLLATVTPAEVRWSHLPRSGRLGAAGSRAT